MSSDKRTVRRPGGERPTRPPQTVPPVEQPVPASRAQTAAAAGEPHKRLDPNDLEALASMDPSELAAFMDGASSRPGVKVGSRVTGTITRVGADNVFVDVGGKSEGMLERAELPDAKAGDTVTAYVLAADELGVQLSQRLSGDAAAGFIVEAAETGIPVEGRVVGRNPGGFDVRIGSVRAFCPVSQMERHMGADPDSYVGQTFEFKVMQAGDDVVVSRRALLESGLGEKREAFWSEAREGDTRRGTIANVTTFGVFVDLDGVEGLVPKRELSWEDEPDMAAFQRGQPLEVRIIDLDPEKRKITLSARDPSLSPWNRIGVDIASGGTYEGTVTRVTDFGAFVEVAPGLQGLMHVSRAGRKMPKAGDKVQVRVGAIDRERQRIELSSADAPAEGIEADAIVKGTIQQVLKNGLVVDLEDGRNGWVPAKEIDLPAGTVISQRFKPGKPIQARVIEDDPARRRATLSLKLEASESQGWRGGAQASGSGSFGTMADLLSKVKPKR